ncbi:hypothetical protein MJH12_02300 [bacterium]|nr:hypothetical protein [bacterium]
MYFKEKKLMDSDIESLLSFVKIVCISSIYQSHDFQLIDKALKNYPLSSLTKDQVYFILAYFYKNNHKFEQSKEYISLIQDSHLRPLAHKYLLEFCKDPMEETDLDHDLKCLINLMVLQDLPNDHLYKECKKAHISLFIFFLTANNFYKTAYGDKFLDLINQIFHGLGPHYKLLFDKKLHPIINQEDESNFQNTASFLLDYHLMSLWYSAIVFLKVYYFSKQRQLELSLLTEQLETQYDNLKPVSGDSMKVLVASNCYRTGNLSKCIKIIQESIYIVQKNHKLNDNLLILFHSLTLCLKMKNFDLVDDILELISNYKDTIYMTKIVEKEFLKLQEYLPRKLNTENFYFESRHLSPEEKRAVNNFSWRLKYDFEYSKNISEYQLINKSGIYNIDQQDANELRVNCHNFNLFVDTEEMSVFLNGNFISFKRNKTLFKILETIVKEYPKPVHLSKLFTAVYKTGKYIHDEETKIRSNLYRLKQKFKKHDALSIIESPSKGSYMLSKSCSFCMLDISNQFIS